MNEPAPGFGDEGNHVEVYDSQNYRQPNFYSSANHHPTLYHSQYSAQPQQDGAFSGGGGGGPVNADPYSYESYGVQQHSTQQPPGYLDEYGQFVPFYQQGYPGQYYHIGGGGTWGQQGGRGRKGSRGRGRGRGGYHKQQQQVQYYGNRYPSEDYEPESEEYGNRPKQFSYQGNRYGHDRQNRKKTTGQTNPDSQEAAPVSERKSKYEQAGYNKGVSELSQQEGEEVFYPESRRTESTYTKESSKADRGYTSQRRHKSMPDERSAAARPKSGQYSRYGKVRGGYTYGKRTSEESGKAMEKSERQDAREQEPTRNNNNNMASLRGRGTTATQRRKALERDGEENSSEESQRKFTDKHKADSSDKTKPKNYKGKKLVFKGDQDDETQRGLLIEQLSSGVYECMVCFDPVRRDGAIWGCSNCYHVFHLRCIKRWARTPASATEGQTGWRCPACQNLCPQVPNQYRCFCGKVKDPDNSRYETPHSCGEMCAKSRTSDCPHPCNILCHPGPCPVCQATVTKSCSCGHFKMSVKCGQPPVIKCQRVCGKTRNCGRHECEVTCHGGQCQPCEETVKQVCYCTAQQREVVCGSAESFATSFSCQGTCKRDLECGHHQCEFACHPGQCEPCKLGPSVVRYCPCLKTPLSELSGGVRQSCTDPVPTCDLVCDKELLCGPPDAPHKCQVQCHIGECPECDGDSEVVCKCGALSNTIACRELPQYTGENQFVCDKRCNKKRDCGRHRCSQLCCVDTEHKCDLICGKRLSCGLHRCVELCHRGNCHTCWDVSFDELRCYCGNEVLYPPVACGTQPPECKKKCTRIHPCGHKVLHNCHSEERCPPCTQLTEKWCLGQHEYRKNIPCHITEVSCGLKCSKPLPCGQHKCPLTCHKGECGSDDQVCSQPCTKLREDCGHMCKAPCHQGQPCPDNVLCKVEVTLMCVCANRTEKVVCHLLTEEKSVQDYQRMTTSLLAMRMGEARDGQSVDISSLLQQKDKQPRPKRLECNQDCALRERNKRLALALEIKNPDLSSKPGPPNYTDFLKEFTKKNSSFVAGIEKALGELVLSAQKSAQKCRSHAFSPMNRDQRRVIHELAEFYGCSTQSYDDEPKKNVAATAYKDKCWRPSVTLTALVQRELHPKAPVPIPHRSSEDQIRTTVQASKQSTQLLGGGTSGGTAWASKSSKPLNSWTTLRSFKSATDRLDDSSNDTTAAGGEGAEGHMTWQTVGGSRHTNNMQAKPAWGKSTPVVATTSMSAYSSSEKSSRKAKKEPVIDYFDMSD